MPQCGGELCDSPPSAFCEDGTSVFYDAVGTCVDDTCEYNETRVDCVADGGTCSDGLCQGLCDGVVCDAPPGPTCEGEVSVRYNTAGTCDEMTGDCEYTEVRTTCSDMGTTCMDGECVNLCEDVRCTSPPDAACAGNVAVGYEFIGMCVMGVCEYPETMQDCSDLGLMCQDGRCVADCEDIACTDVPPDSCDGDTARNYSFGLCDMGACSYPSTDTDCSAIGETCMDGACTTFCDGVFCNAPPARECVGEVARTYANPGACNLGTCEYQQTDTDCAAMGWECDQGRCIDPCVGISCAVPPAAECQGNVSVTYVGPGMCSFGTCEWGEVTEDCTAIGETCMNGSCAGVCDGVTCVTPPSSDCDGNTAIFFDSVGVCVSGMCDYGETRVDCTAMGRTLLRGDLRR